MRDHKLDNAPPVSPARKRKSRNGSERGEEEEEDGFG